MDKWNLIIDVARCENCNNCALAAKDELVGNDFPGYSAPHAAQGPGVVRIERKVRGQAPLVDIAYVPVMCQHCDNAPCMQNAGDAITRRADGIVVIDPVRAHGRRDLVDACPYGAIVWNEAQQLPQSWFFDAHLLDSGAAAPRCVGVCPTGAMEAVLLDDAAMAARAAADGLRPLRADLDTRPRVHYQNLGRFDRCFIAGSVRAIVGGQDECIAGAVVELLAAGARVAEATTGAFGDFKFDGLAPDGGIYEVSVVHPAHGRARATAVAQADSLSLGSMLLDRS